MFDEQMQVPQVQVVEKARQRSGAAFQGKATGIRTRRSVQPEPHSCLPRLQEHGFLPKSWRRQRRELLRLSARRWTTRKASMRQRTNLKSLQSALSDLNRSGAEEKKSAWHKRGDSTGCGTIVTYMDRSGCPITSYEFTKCSSGSSPTRSKSPKPGKPKVGSWC